MTFSVWCERTPGLSCWRGAPLSEGGDALQATRRDRLGLKRTAEMLEVADVESAICNLRYDSAGHLLSASASAHQRARIAPPTDIHGLRLSPLPARDVRSSLTRESAEGFVVMPVLWR